MARLFISGFDELEEELKKMGEATGDLAKAMVLAGSDLMATQMETTARAYGHIGKNRKDYLGGQMIAAIGYAKNPREVGGVIRNDIFPKGTDSKGVRNAEKAFLLHYGWSGYKGDHWFDEAIQLGEEIAYDKMYGMMRHFAETGEVPVVLLRRHGKQGG